MLKITGLCAGYPGHPVLDHLDLTVPKGSFTAVVGPNGCGKSTLLKALVGILPYEGSVSFDGTLLLDLSDSQRAKTLSFLPQSRSVPQLSVEKLVLHGRFPYLGYPRRYRDEDRQAAKSALKALGLEAFAHRELGTLSGGERQKAYLAMLLAQDTPVILMDEPTAALDICHKFEVLKIAQRLAREGRTVIMVLHELELALQFADQVAVMDKGRIVSFGRPEETVQSGILEQTFRIRVMPVETPQGVRYWMEPRR